MLAVGFQRLTSIFHPDYDHAWGGYSRSLAARFFCENIAANFSPDYLFLTGDHNPRRSTQGVGQWSALDILAAIMAAVWLMNRPLWNLAREWFRS